MFSTKHCCLLCVLDAFRCLCECDYLGMLFCRIGFVSSSYLHHEENGVEDDQYHDEVFEGSGDDNSPYLVLEAVHLLRHVSLQGPRGYGKVNARFLETKVFLQKKISSTFTKKNPF